MTSKEIEKYRDEYNQLRSDDAHFEAMWDDNEKDFQEWLQENVIGVK